MPRKNKFEAVKTRSMSNEVAASSSQNIMDNHLSHSDEVVKDINNYDEVDNTNGDEVVDQSEIILDQASDNEGDKDQKENDNNMHLDFGDLVSSMDGNNFSYDEETNYVMVNREITVRFDKVDVKYYPGSFIMPEQLAYTVKYPNRVQPAYEPEQKQDQLNTPKDKTEAELEKQCKARKKKKQSKHKQDKRQSGVSLIDIEAEKKQKMKDDQEAITLNKCFAISPDSNVFIVKIKSLKIGKLVYKKGQPIERSLAFEYMRKQSDKVAVNTNTSDEVASQTPARVIKGGNLPKPERRSRGGDQRTPSKDEPSDDGTSTDTETVNTSGLSSQSSRENKNRPFIVEEFPGYWTMRVEHYRSPGHSIDSEARRNQQIKPAAFMHGRIETTIDKAVQHTQKKQVFPYDANNKFKFTCLSAETYRIILCAYVNFLRRGPNLVVMDVFIYPALTEEFRNDFKTKFSAHIRNINSFPHKKALAHLYDYTQVPNDEHLTALTAENLIPMLFIAMQPNSTFGDGDLSFNQFANDVIGDEAMVFGNRHKHAFQYNALVTEYPLVSAGLNLMLDEIQKALSIMEWFMNRDYPMSRKAGLIHPEHGLVKLMQTHMNRVGFSREWEILTDDVARFNLKCSSWREYFNFIRLQIDKARLELEPGQERFARMQPSVGTRRIPPDEPSQPSKPRNDKSITSRKTRVHNMATIPEPEEENDSEDTGEDISDEVEPPLKKPVDEYLSPTTTDTTVTNDEVICERINNLNSYPVPSTKHKMAPIKPKRDNSAPQPPKVCDAMLIRGECNKPDCRYNHDAGTVEKARDRLIAKYDKSTSQMATINNMRAMVEICGSLPDDDLFSQLVANLADEEEV